MINNQPNSELKMYYYFKQGINNANHQHCENMKNFNSVANLEQRHDVQQMQDLQNSMATNAANSKSLADRLKGLNEATELEQVLGSKVENIRSKLIYSSNVEVGAAEMIDIDIRIQELQDQIFDLWVAKPADLKKMKELQNQVASLLEKTIEILDKLNENKEFKETLDMKLFCMRLNMVSELNDWVINFIVDVKKARHEEKAKEILESTNPDRKLLSNLIKGDLTSVKSYLKLGREGEAIVKGVAREKSTSENRSFHEAFNYLIENFNSSTVSVENKSIDGKDVKVISVQLQTGETLQFTPQSFKNVDFTKIKVSQEQLKKYETLLNTPGTLEYGPNASENEHIGQKIPTREDFTRAEKAYNMEESGKLLTYEEKLAINIYTTDTKTNNNAYKLINSFLRGDISGAATGGGVTEAEAFKEALIHTVIILSALSKLPDEGKRTSVRAEGGGLPDDKLEEWVFAANHGQSYVESLALLSSASEKPSDSFFNESTSKAVMMLSGENGKKITPWSMFGGAEREVLFLPTPLKFQSSIQRDYNGNTLTILIAKSVSGSIEETSLDNSVKIAQQNIRMNKNTSAQQAAIIKQSKI